MNRRKFTNAVIAAGSYAAAAYGRLLPAKADAVGRTEPLNVVLPTFGGLQVWADELLFHDWRIQRNVLTDHYRLLDGRNRRHAWGTLADCRGALARLREQHKLPPMQGTLVLALHGLFRTAHAMSGITGDLNRRTNFKAISVSYPTTRGALGDHARGLARVIENLDGVDEIHFVAHSLGGLVIRQYLAGAAGSVDPRIKRLVMLGPPNQGARLAEVLGRLGLFHVIVGPTGAQLGQDWAKVCCGLGTLNCQFGIIAGGRGNPKGFNPLLGEDNDLIVTVASTRLQGASDFRVVNVAHTFLMDDALVQQYTRNFLQHGCFESSGKCQPICDA